MDVAAAGALIRAAVEPGPATWADLGAGSGTFTIALARRLGAGARVHAVDTDAAALRELRRAARGLTGVTITTQTADFRRIELAQMDGILLANVLHFVPPAEQPAVVAALVRWLRPAGRLLVVDYDDRAANPWVPYPVSSARLAGLMQEAELGAPREAGRRPSRYGGTIYAVWGMVPGTPA